MDYATCMQSYPYVTGAFDGHHHHMDAINKSSTFTNDPRITAQIEQMELWDQFHKYGNEMIITKPGRRMFPKFKVKIDGLDPKERYLLMLDMAPASQHRFKFQQFQWILAGKAEPPPHYHQPYVHPDSPAQGSHWMEQPISFYKIKLTNNVMDPNPGHIVLNSMHKYVPRLHVLATTTTETTGEPQSTSAQQWVHVASFTFPQTVFMAVTAYQNEDITRLKIENNPFAKGFRENEDHRRDRKKSKSVKKSMDCDSNSSSDEESKKRSRSPDHKEDLVKDKTDDNSSLERDESSPAYQQLVAITTCPCLMCKSHPMYGHVPYHNMIFSQPLINPLLSTTMPYQYHNFHNNAYVQPPYIHPHESLMYPGHENWIGPLPINSDTYTPFAWPRRY